MTSKVFTALLITAVIAAGPAQADDAFQSFRTALIEYFEIMGYLPVIVDRGYQIGDVVNIDGVNLYARAARCFPQLKVPAPVQTSLPAVVRVYDIGMSFGLWLRQIFSSSAGADLKRRVEIRFTEVSAVSVALLDLRDALNRTACPKIAPLVDGTLAPLQPGQAPFFVVSELLIGKREARLEFATRADLELKAKEITQYIGDANDEAGNHPARRDSAYLSRRARGRGGVPAAMAAGRVPRGWGALATIPPVCRSDAGSGAPAEP